MSYDLFFKSPKLGQTELERYFNARRWYTVKATKSGAQAWYGNEDSGVYFSFDVSSESVALNVNYFRPSFFGLEAADEVTAFVDAFQPTIHDPQSEGMGEGPYSRDGFLRGWNAGNRFGHRGILAQVAGSQTFHTVPAARLQALWRWNYQRDRTADYLNTVEMLPCFVPKITPVLIGGVFRTIVAWEANIPILLPDVDAIIVPGEDGLAIVDRIALDSALAQWRIRPVDTRLALPAREVVFDNDAVPPAITRAVAQHATAWAGEGIGWDQIHDEELMS